jgi:hypothetical protein
VQRETTFREKIIHLDSKRNALPKTYNTYVLAHPAQIFVAHTPTNALEILSVLPLAMQREAEA